MKRLAFVTLLVLLAGLLMPAPGAAGAARVINREFKAEPGKELILDIEAGGDIFIEGWESDEVHIEIRIEGRYAEDVEIEFDENRSGVEVKAEYERKYRKSRLDMVVKVKVPSEFDIDFETTGGDVDIQGVKGFIKGQTMGGDIDFRKLEGKLSVTTMGGDISVSDSKLDGTVKTMGGDVDITDVEGDLKGKTFGGDVDYSNVRRGEGDDGDDDDEVSISTFGGDLDLDYEGKNVRAKTFGGDIEVKRAKEVKVSTMGGDIDVAEAPEGADVHTMGGDIKIESAGEYVKAKTMGGDIEVDEVDGWVTATTMGGDVTVTMIGDPDRGKRDILLKSMGGDIELTVPGGLSMEFDIEIAVTKSCRKECRIVSDFDIDVEKTDKWESHWFQKRKYIYGKGEVGSGKNTVKIRTTNGNVTIKKGD